MYAHMSVVISRDRNKIRLVICRSDSAPLTHLIIGVEMLLALSVPIPLMRRYRTYLMACSDGTVDTHNVIVGVLSSLIVSRVSVLVLLVLVVVITI